MFRQPLYDLVYELVQKIDDSFLDSINPRNSHSEWQTSIAQNRDPKWCFGGGPTMEWIITRQSEIQTLTRLCQQTNDPLQSHMIAVLEDTSRSLQIMAAYTDPDVPLDRRRHLGELIFGTTSSQRLMPRVRAVTMKIASQMRETQINAGGTSDNAFEDWRATLNQFLTSRFLYNFAEVISPHVPASMDAFLSRLKKVIRNWKVTEVPDMGPVRMRVIKGRHQIELNPIAKLAVSEIRCLVFHETTHILFDALCEAYPASFHNIQYCGPLWLVEGLAVMAEAECLDQNSHPAEWIQGVELRRLQVAARYLANYMRYYEEHSLRSICTFLEHELTLPSAIAASITQRIDRLANKDSQYFVGVVRIERHMKKHGVSLGTFAGQLALDGFRYDDLN